MNALPMTTAALYEGDFVKVDPTGREGKLDGTIVGVSSEANTSEDIYIVQPYTATGPTDATIAVTRSELSLHPTGRMSVMDNISRLRFNHR